MQPEGQDRQSLARRRVLSSAAWAGSQQVVLLGSSAVVGIILARTLPVSAFGVYAYAIALTTIGTAVVTGGLSGLAIKAFLDDPDHQQQTMSALIAVREAFALIAYVLLLAITLTSGDTLVREATALSGLVLFARAFDGVEYWFQARLESRKTAAVRIAVVAVMLGLRLLAAVLGASLWIFLVLFVAEGVVIGTGLAFRYLRAGDSAGFGRPQIADVRKLLSRSWLLLLSAVANQINFRADVVLIQALIGSAAVGTYAAAARVSELAYFLPVVVMTATFPALLETRKRHGQGSVAYSRMLQRSYDRACWAGVLVGAIVWLMGPWAIRFLYGDAYAPAGEILRIHVLALPFVFMAAVMSKWIIAEDLLWTSLKRHVLAAMINIALNLILIPHHGLKGAAIATVVSYAFASYGACFVGRATWPPGRSMSLALVWPIRLALRLVTGPPSENGGMSAGRR